MTKSTHKGRRVFGWYILLMSILVLYGRIFPQYFHIQESDAYRWMALIAFVARTIEPAIGWLFIILGIYGLRKPKNTYRLHLWYTVFAGVLLISTPYLLDLTSKKNRTIVGETITVQTTNIYWRNTSFKSLQQVIEKTSADILVFPEWTPTAHNTLQSVLKRRGLIDQSYPKPGEGNGISMFLHIRYDPSIPQMIPLDTSGTGFPQIHGVIHLQDKPISVYGLHLLGAHFLRGLKMRRPQLAELVEVWKQDPNPKILLGDFNFTERSPQAELLTSLGFREVNQLCGQELGLTWPTIPNFPIMRIDHIYLSKELGCKKAWTETVPGSDHKSVIALVGWTKANP